MAGGYAHASETQRCLPICVVYRWQIPNALLLLVIRFVSYPVTSFERGYRSKLGTQNLDDNNINPEVDRIWICQTTSTQKIVILTVAKKTKKNIPNSQIDILASILPIILKNTNINDYPPVMTFTVCEHENGPVEIVSFPMNSMVISSSLTVTVTKPFRVNLNENPMENHHKNLIKPP